MVNTSVEKAASPATAPLEGRLLVDIAKERGVSPADVMFDVARDDKLETFFRISGPVDVDESRLERILQSPATLVGISDGGAHLQTFAGGDYTSYFLAHWVREKGAFTLEEGVAALTSRVAHFLGITDRGTLEAGKAADLVIFDPDTVEPLTLQTLDDIPGGGTRMTKAARGIPWVLVNGQPGRRGRRGHDGGPGRGARHRLSSSPMARTLPVLRDWNRFYWTSGEDGRLRFQHCGACDALQHPPAPVCRACGGDELDTQAVSGRGTVQSHTTNVQQWSADYPPPFVVAVVAIDEDPRVRLTTNIVGCEPETVQVGMRVRGGVRARRRRVGAAVRTHRRAAGAVARRTRRARTHPIRSSDGAPREVRGSRRAHGHRHVTHRPQAHGPAGVADRRGDPARGGGRRDSRWTTSTVSPPTPPPPRRAATRRAV